MEGLIAVDVDKAVEETCLFTDVSCRCGRPQTCNTSVRTETAQVDQKPIPEA